MRYLKMIEQAFTFKNGFTLQNRIGKSALEEELGIQGRPEQEIQTLYSRWAQGKPGLIITGNVAIDKRCPTGPRSVVLEDDTHLPLFTEWAKKAQKGGSKIIMQINHAGRQAPRIFVKQPVAPSAIGMEVPGGRGVFNIPKELTHDEILELINRYVKTAELAVKAGFDGVQIHGAHGYLISQFLSPRTNQRKDEWGGSLANRAKFLFAIAEGMRKVVPEDKLLAIKLNSADFQRGGFDENDSLWIIQELEKRGLDLLEVSGGNYESPAMVGNVSGKEQKQQMRQSTIDREAYFLEFAEKVRTVSQVPIMVTGGFRSTQAMEAALSSNALDIVGMGKPFVLYPDIAQQLINGEITNIIWPMKRIKNPAIDSQSMMGSSWTQMERMANGKEPNLKLGTYWNLVIDLRRMMKNSKKYKQWLKTQKQQKQQKAA